MLTGVPSLYVRVYRQDSQTPSFFSCSLIICEGISTLIDFGAHSSRFPHYMWGYIACSMSLYEIASIPSLYVRVYLPEEDEVWDRYSSLIICEGISVESVKGIGITTFPHYMWGYIGFVPCKIFLPGVPSLYVRVYRSIFSRTSIVKRSLIICEGISGIVSL